jgi:hypothetical protein
MWYHSGGGGGGGINLAPITRKPTGAGATAATGQTGGRSVVLAELLIWSASAATRNTAVAASVTCIAAANVREHTVFAAAVVTAGDAGTFIDIDLTQLARVAGEAVAGKVVDTINARAVVRAAFDSAHALVCVGFAVIPFEPELALAVATSRGASRSGSIQALLAVGAVGARPCNLTVGATVPQLAFARV